MSDRGRTRVAQPGTSVEPLSAAGPTRRELVVQVRNVAHDLPTFLTAPLYRNRHLRWAATSAEAWARLPGDALVPRAQFRATRAITIHAPPQAVWPWLVQVGYTAVISVLGDLSSVRPRQWAATRT